MYRIGPTRVLFLTLLPRYTIVLSVHTLVPSLLPGPRTPFHFIQSQRDPPPAVRVRQEGEAAALELVDGERLERARGGLGGHGEHRRLHPGAESRATSGVSCRVSKSKLTPTRADLVSQSVALLLARNPPNAPVLLQAAPHALRLPNIKPGGRAGPLPS